LKVLYISNALTHYYNLVLSKLNRVPGIELIVVVPRQSNLHVGEGVYQTRDGISFKVYELEDRHFLFYSSFKGLAKILHDEKPDIILIVEQYLLTLVFNIPVICAIKKLRIKRIMQTIPFRIPRFEEAKKRLMNRTDIFQKYPRWLNTFLHKSRMVALMKLSYIYTMKFAYNIPDALLLYIDEGYDIFGSYGVSKDRIFITYNSPDTDKLFEIRQSIAFEEPILPRNVHRLIHVGRLVEWKRVDILIRAFSRIKLKYADAELLIIGYGPQEQALKDLADDLHIGADIKFLGGVYDPKILGRYFMASTIYVLAGMGGLSINDAMTFGLPVICSVCDGTEKKLVRDEFNGKYFKDGDEDDLFEKIIYLFDRPQLLKQMGLNSTSIIKNEINIHTVIKGFLAAFQYVSKEPK